MKCGKWREYSNVRLTETYSQPQIGPILIPTCQIIGFLMPIRLICARCRNTKELIGCLVYSSRLDGWIENGDKQL